MKAIVIGASGGIGRALATQIAAQGRTVVALGRQSDPPLDLEKDETIAHAASALAGEAPFDLVIIASGLLHGGGIVPEKSLRQIDGPALERLFRVNAIGPAVVIRHFLPLLARDRRAVFAALSARVGSIGDNRLGGWIGYRASKAALNQVIRTASIELARTHPQAVMVGLHPGTVETGLSAPFQRSVAPGKLFSASQSAELLLKVIEGVTPADSGHCLDWAGERVTP